MIYLILFLLLALAAALAITWQLAASVATSDRLIREQRQRIALLEDTLADREQRIALHAQHNDLLSRRNNLLEWAISYYIRALPKSNQRSALLARREINPN